MKKILLFGAGKSATCLIDYLGKICSANNWNLIVADADLNLADAKTKTYPAATAISFDVSDTIMRQQYIAQSDLVISMLPPSMHIIVANDCLLFAKHLLTASYLDSQI